MNKKNLLILMIISTILIFAAAFFITNAKLSSRQYGNIVVRVAGDNNFPPYEYLDENQSYAGFNVDIMRAIALSTGMEIKYYPMAWDEACEKLKNGDVDIIQGMKYTKERDRYYDFSKEYLENSQSIFVLSNNKSINDFQDLNGKRIALQRGDVAISTLYSLKDHTTIFTENQEQAIYRLLEGSADAYIGNTLTGVYVIDRIGATNRTKIVGKTLNPTKYSLAVKEGNTQLLNIINRGLAEIKRNGTYDIIYRKWFGRPVNFPSWYLKRMTYVLGTVIMILAIVMIISLRWTNILKKEVGKRTKELNNANCTLQNKNRQIKLERDFREQLLNSIFSGIVTINNDGIITFANKPARKILDMEDGSLVGINYRQTYIKDLFSRDEIPQHSANKEIMIDNRRVFINYRVHLVHNVDDEEEAIIIFRDVTEEKLMQENIRTKDKMQSLGNLITGIAHEIRNPLTSIKTYAELIPKKADDPKFRTMISKDIPQEIERLDKLIKDLLEYSKPRKPFMENICLSQAVDDALMLLKNDIYKQNIQLVCNIDKNIYVSFDKNHFRQILINLLLNAVESLDKDGKHISIWADEKESSVALSIKDNGCGIDKNSLSRIYNPFFTTKCTGTGLGLYVSYQLASENNAEIGIDTEQGEGTTFTIVFKKTGGNKYAEAADN